MSGSSSDESEPPVSDHPSDEVSDSNEDSGEIAHLEKQELMVGTFALV